MFQFQLAQLPQRRSTRSRSGRRLHRRAILLGSAVLTTLAPITLAGCGSAPDQVLSAPRPTAAGSGFHSMTQVVKNGSSTPLTLTGFNVDNGGQLQPGYATVIQPRTTQSYKATNEKNGVQLWLTFTTSTGATVNTDSNNPKRDSNNTTVKITGSGIGLNDANGAFSVTDGDNPTATVGVVDCTHGCTMTLTTCGVAGC